MNEVYVVFEGDQWLSNSSLELKGVFPTFDDAVTEILDYNMIKFREFDEYFEEGATVNEKAEIVREILEKELRCNKQTQGYEINYTIKQIDFNKWV